MNGVLLAQTGITLPDILQMVASSGQDGSLQLSEPTGQRSGCITLKDGRVINASFGTSRDEEAIAEVLAAPALRFEFVRQVQDPSIRIQKSLTDLLLSSAVHCDDQGEHGRPPAGQDFRLIIENGVPSEAQTTEQARRLQDDQQYLDYHGVRIGAALGFDRLLAGAMAEPGLTVAFRHQGDGTRIFASETLGDLAQAIQSA